MTDLKLEDTESRAAVPTDRPMAVIAFVDLAGFSAITDVFGDESALAILDVFEGIVSASLAEGGRLVSGSAMKSCWPSLTRTAPCVALATSCQPVERRAGSP